MVKTTQRIEDFFRQRYGKEAVFLPSGRLALYLAFREWLRPGQRLLLSSVNDDVVFFTVLAAGLIPVVAPVNPRTGNLDPDAVDPATWKTLNAVMTTNLYGIPDQMDRLTEICERYGLLLIEDACQALDTRVGGRLIGKFSPVAIFSLSKHMSGVGGILAFSEEQRRRTLLDCAQKESLHPSMLGVLRAGIKDTLRFLARTTGTLQSLRRIRRSCLPHKPDREGHRMAYALGDVFEAQAAGCGLNKFDRWVRVDNANYRTLSVAWAVASTLRQLEEFEENRASRLEGTRKLLELGFTPKDIALPANSALLRVPLFVQQREKVIRDLLKPQLKSAQFPIGLDYIYDPPLDQYASSQLADRLASPVNTERWSRDVLPVNPLCADRFIHLLHNMPTALAAA